MSSRRPLAHGCWRLAVALPLATAAAAILIAHYVTADAQSADQLTVYSPQTFYAIPLLDVKGQPYVGLVELLEPLGSVEARSEGRKYRLHFTLPGSRPIEAQFNEGKEKSKVRGSSFFLPANFALQNGRGYVPLSSLPEVLTKLLATPVQLHASAQRLFIGDVAIHFALELDKSASPKLVVSFPSRVNPSIATEPGGVRFTFRREPVVSSGQDNVSFNDPMITGAVFNEHNGLAELDVKATVPLMANFADGGRTIIVSAAPLPPPPAPPAPTPRAEAPAQTAAPTPNLPAAPRFMVLIDPAHGGSDSGASITPSLLEKDVVLALARRVQRELASRGIAVAMLRNSDVTIPLEQRAVAADAARPALYVSLHAANTGRGVHVFTSLLPAANLQRQGFLPWETAQAAFLDLSGTAAGSVAAELEARRLPNATLLAPLRPMNSIAAPAIAVEIAPPDAKVEDIAGAQYQEQVAQSIAAGVAAVRSKLPAVRP
ncbi:MAG TPA: N-acetylmuramoyl-L-alanine amidase [Candidatus Binatia bacterium]|nr:N-acetylmuramoyl-L-alanine amidase [Candidatus Binatia bacterium]